MITMMKYSRTSISGLTGTASYPDMQKIRIIVFFFVNRLHWQFEFRLLLFTKGTLRGEFRPRQTRQLPRAVDLKGRLLSCQSY